MNANLIIWLDAMPCRLLTVHIYRAISYRWPDVTTSKSSALFVNVLMDRMARDGEANLKCGGNGSREAR